MHRGRPAVADCRDAPNGALIEVQTEAMLVLIEATLRQIGRHDEIAVRLAMPPARSHDLAA
jgi:hypothetical protein